MLNPKTPSCAAPLPSPPRHLLHHSMERTTSEISVAEVNESGGSAPPTGGHDTSIPPSVDDFCDRMGSFEMEHRPTRDEIARLKLQTRPEGMDPRAFFVNYDADSAEAARGARQSRKFEVERFTTQYVYGNNCMEQRHCVWTEDSCLWSEKSSGIMWVGVHGADSVCVVTRRGVLDTTRLRGNLLKPTTVEIVLSIFRKSIICEIEDLADPSSELRQRFQQSIKKPFGVVSANPGTNNIHKESGHEASSAEYDEKKAIEFLKEKMKCDTNFTVTETTKTAICAFQHLFRKKLKAAEIEVSVMDPKYLDPKYFVDVRETVKDSVQKLEIGEVEKYLDAFDESDPGEIEEHSAAIDNLGNPLKKQRTSLLPETPVPSPGGSSNISETMD